MTSFLILSTMRWQSWNINKGELLMSKKLIQCCPHCGSTEGLYTKITYVNVPWCFGFRCVSSGVKINGNAYSQNPLSKMWCSVFRHLS